MKKVASYSAYKILCTILALTVLFSNVMLSASANSSIVGVLTIFSSLDGDSSTNIFGNVGHAWISFLNTSSKVIQVGVYSVNPMEEVTIGKWNSGVENRNDHVGIWYNREAEVINSYDDMPGRGLRERASLSMEISLVDIDKMNKRISNEDYWRLDDNCSTFATNIWNDISSIELNAYGLSYGLGYDLRSYELPQVLLNSIKSQPEYELNRGVQNPRLIMCKELIAYGNAQYQYYSYPSRLADVSSYYVGKTITLKSLEVNQYVTSNTDQDVAGINATVNRDAASTWEYFDVIAGDYGTVGFKAHGNCNYLSTRIDQSKNNAYIQAAYGQNYTKPYSWESFRIFEKDGVQYIQSQANGKWVQAATNETDTPLKAAGASASTWERFQIELVSVASSSGSSGSSSTSGSTGTSQSSGSGASYVSQHYHGSEYNEGLYEGEWSSGQPNGYGKLTYDDFGDGQYYALNLSDGSQAKALYYEGNFSNGMRSGKGKVVYESGWYDDGTFYGVWQAGKVVFEGKRGQENKGYWDITITATSSVNSKTDYNEWHSINTLSVLSSAEGSYKLQIPANYKLLLYESATSQKSSWHFDPRETGWSITCSKKYILTNGRIRYSYVGSSGTTYYIESDDHVKEIPANATNESTYVVSYEANGGNDAPAQQKKAHGSTLTLSNETPSRTGYNFVGWSTDKGAKTANYQPGGSFTINANTTLYAVWSTKTYSVSYHANGGNGAPAQQKKTHGSTLTLSNETPSRTGYNFVGWSTDKGAKTASYQPRDSFTNNENTILYAVWSAKTYSITYHANGGDDAPAQQKKTYGSDITLSEKKPVRDGYIFIGWAVSSSSIYPSYYPGSTYSQNADVVLYAVWEQKVSPAFAYSMPSAWAKESISEAYEMDLIPEYMLKNFSAAATRMDFVRLAFNTIEKEQGLMYQVLCDQGIISSTETSISLTYTDVPTNCGYDMYDSYRVAALSALGIVKGVGNDKFEPNRSITRQEAATLLSRLDSFLLWDEVKPYIYNGSTDAIYADNSQLASWAYNAVYNMKAIDVMNGVGNNRFGPSLMYTREQSITTFMRLIHYHND